MEQYPFNARTFLHETAIIDYFNFKAKSIDGKIKVRQIDRLEVKCSCGILYFANLKREKCRKHPWKCRSCSTSLDWQEDDYKIALTNGTANMSDENVKKRSEVARKSMLNNWTNPIFRETVHQAHQSQEYKNKMSDLVKSKLDNDPEFERNLMNRLEKGTKGKPTLYNGKWFKSSFEKRFVIILDELGIKWKYEPKGFKLKYYHNKRYYPDFYIREHDLWVEIKGYWRGEAKDKFSAFMKEYNLNTILLFKSDLKDFETNKKLNEAGQKNKHWVESCKRPRS